MRKWVVLLLILGTAAFLALHWPRLNQVETGATPQYPDLQPRTYPLPEARVARGAESALRHLSRFRLVGEARGARGTDIAATAQTRGLGFTDDLTIRIRPEGGRTRVDVRSASRVGKWDFGQNARNVREFLAALDAELR